MLQPNVRRIWLFLGGDQTLPVCPSQWQEYGQEVSYHLTQNHLQIHANVTQSNQRVINERDDKLILDLKAFTHPPLPYGVLEGKVLMATNPSLPPSIRGKRTVAGYDCDLWDVFAKSPHLLPTWVNSAIQIHKYFYQVHLDSLDSLERLKHFICDNTGTSSYNMPLLGAGSPRRRVVLAVDVAMQLPIHGLSTSNTTIQGSLHNFENLGDVCAVPNVVVIEETNNATNSMNSTTNQVVYEWWCGEVPLQISNDMSMPRGRWKRYHPHVSEMIEGQFQTCAAFINSEIAIKIDEVRYMLQHISQTSSYTGLTCPCHQGLWRMEYLLSIEYPCFTPLDRKLNNCFVQFQTENPIRRRPVRRLVDASNIIEQRMMSGCPCLICLSEEGQLTGCSHGHAICESCLRRCMRAIIGDTLTTTNLICGCFGTSTRKALLMLAERADISFAETWEVPPVNLYEKQDWESEISTVQKQFLLTPPPEAMECDDDPFHPFMNLYANKMMQWFSTVTMSDISHLFYACSHPACCDKVDNWMLISDFEKMQSDNLVMATWTCPDNHVNYVLPSEEEIDNINKCLLSHPEYYTENCGHNGIPLRRYRLCPECADSGILLFAVHGGDCKQYPGYGNGHRHTFCFACTRTWGDSHSNCNHGSRNCVDPGIQQIRSVNKEKLEIGHIDSREYISWLQGNCYNCPHTIFSGFIMNGNERQLRLGLTDKQIMLNEMRRGTQ